MTRRATFTQAELDRALRAAEKLGREVAIVGGVIRILAPGAGPGLPSTDDAEAEADKWFGVGR